MKKIMTLPIALTMAITMAACTTEQGDRGGTNTVTETVAEKKAIEEEMSPETESYEWPKFLSMSTGSNGGTAFVAGSVICQLITDHHPTTATAQVTTGAGQSIELIRSGDCELGLADQSAVVEAISGTGTFEGNAYKDLAVVCYIYNSYWQQMVTKASGIEAISELAGKTCVVGGPNSGTLSSTAKAYASHDMDIASDLSPEYVGISAGIELLQNRQAVGITCIAPYPFSSFVELTATDYAKLIPMSEDAIEKMISEDPSFSRGVIPAGTYENQEKDVNTCFVPYLMVCDANADEEMIYEIVKSIYDNLDALKEQNQVFKEMELEKALEPISVELHPGAERFFREQGLK